MVRDGRVQTQYALPVTRSIDRVCPFPGRLPVGLRTKLDVRRFESDTVLQSRGLDVQSHLVVPPRTGGCGQRERQRPQWPLEFKTYFGALRQCAQTGREVRQRRAHEEGEPVREIHALNTGVAGAGETSRGLLWATQRDNQRRQRDDPVAAHPERRAVHDRSVPRNDLEARCGQAVQRVRRVAGGDIAFTGDEQPWLRPNPIASDVDTIDDGFGGREFDYLTACIEGQRFPAEFPACAVDDGDVPARQ